MELNSLGAPLKLHNPLVKRKRPFNWTLLIIVLWLGLPVIAIGGMMLLVLTGHSMGD
jgi:hypothetical protein